MWLHLITTGLYVSLSISTIMCLCVSMSISTTKLKSFCETDEILVDESSSLSNNVFLNNIIGAKYPSVYMSMVDLHRVTWLATFTWVSSSNHIFFHPQVSIPRPYLRDTSSISLIPMYYWSILYNVNVM
jgi:hypothetical protein